MCKQWESNVDGATHVFMLNAENPRDSAQSWDFIFVILYDPFNFCDLWSYRYVKKASIIKNMLRKLKYFYEPAISLQGVYTRELK